VGHDTPKCRSLDSRSPSTSLRAGCSQAHVAGRSGCSGAYAPFGETYTEAGTPDRSFTGQNQDTIQGSTTGLYDFLFREYAQYGRWISPDPAGLGAVDPTNPQSWNRYAYVVNNPTGLVDPLGLDFFGCLLDVSNGGNCGGGGGIGGGPCVFVLEYVICPLPPLIILPSGPGGIPGSGSGASSNAGKHIGGPFPGGETLGIPSGMRLNPGNISCCCPLIRGASLVLCACRWGPEF
jgi:RHS repeat-associated protein